MVARHVRRVAPAPQQAAGALPPCPAAQRAQRAPDRQAVLPGCHASELVAAARNAGIVPGQGAGRDSAHGCRGGLAALRGEQEFVEHRGIGGGGRELGRHGAGVADRECGWLDFGGHACMGVDGWVGGSATSWPVGLPPGRCSACEKLPCAFTCWSRTCGCVHAGRVVGFRLLLNCLHLHACMATKRTAIAMGAVRGHAFSCRASEAGTPRFRCCAALPSAPACACMLLRAASPQRWAS